MKKAAYRSLNIPMTISTPTKLNMMLLAREGKTRQIMNQGEFVDAIKSSLGNQVRCVVLQSVGGDESAVLRKDPISGSGEIDE